MNLGVVVICASYAFENHMPVAMFRNLFSEGSLNNKIGAWKGYNPERLSVTL
mgnify:CR=1 FL=1